MHLSSSGRHGAVTQLYVPQISSPKRAQSDYRKALLKKMSELNTSTNNQRQLSAGLATYENFCASDNNFPMSSVKQSSQGQLRSRQMNGQAGGDSPLTPNSPIQWQDFQQNQMVRTLRLELEERKRKELQLYQIIEMLRQQQQGTEHTDQINGSSLTPDGLPAAPSSDGIGESVKDGRIRRLSRDLTMMKSKLYEAEARQAAAEKERDKAYQQVASLSSLLADSDRRATNLEQQLTNMASAAAAGGGENLDSLKGMLDKQRAELGTLKESLQRLNRENQCLKESAAVLNSRQPASLGSPSGGSSVAGCSQELDYLHKVVDTLKATVQEQHAKLCSLRSLHDKSSQASTTLPVPVRAQSFPISSNSSASRVTPASMADGLRGPAAGREVVTSDYSEWSVDGSTHSSDVLSRSVAAHVVPSTTTILTCSNISGGGNNLTLSSSSRSNQAVQDDETMDTLGNGIQKLNITNSKPIPSVSTGRLALENKNGATSAQNPNYFMALSQDNNINWVSQSKPSTSPGDSSAAMMATHRQSESQVAAPRRPEVVATSSSGSRPLSRSEVIGVSSGLGRPSISRSSSTQVPSNTPKGATVEDMLEALGGRSDPSLLNPSAMSTTRADGVATSNLPAAQLPMLPGMVGSATALQMSTRQARPQFVFEAEVEDVASDLYPPAARGGGNFQQQQQPNYPPQPQRAALAASSSGFTPQPPPAVPPHKPQASSSSPLSNYQTASAAVTSDRDGMHVLNKHMMGGGNMIYQQNPQHTLFGVGATTLPKQNSQNLTFTAQALSPLGTQQQQQQQQLPYSTTNVSSSQPGGQHAVYSNSPQQLVDPPGPRVHSDRSCPVCGQDFSHVPMEDFQAHVYECFDEAGPETMKAPGEERSAGNEISASDRSCPLCNAKFEPSVPQADFERHVHSHFGEENFEMVS